MDMNNFITVAYIVSGVLFILSLGGLSAQETARRGNFYGILGMAIAIAATLFNPRVTAHGWLIPALIIGAVAGAVVAHRVVMTAMPQLVAMLHSFVGLAAVFVGLASYLNPPAGMTAAESAFHHIEIVAGVFIGAITFTGSVVAFAKLQGVIGSRPLILPGRHLLNLALALLCGWLGYVVLRAAGHAAIGALLLITLIACLIGAHIVWAIGGADMPVVVSMLNSYSGWAAAAAGFMLSNDLLIITGALVGSSGAILSYIMCRAMNRKFVSVILGGFGAASGAVVARAPGEPAGAVVPITPDETATLLREARNVIIVPGYGMAVAQAQYALRAITQMLREWNVNVRFAIHPVAGRLPGHMNVLLAEARVPYDIVHEMDEINHDFRNADVALVIGANDIVNPAAIDDPGSPIAGMPVLHVWEARNAIVMKRGMASGYAGIDNPLFYKENTRMLFGDARETLEAVLSRMQNLNG